MANSNIEKLDDSLLAHLYDLQRKSLNRHMHLESFFLNEAELMHVMEKFPESMLIRYEGGYPNAKKKKVIFCIDEEDDLSDIVCIRAIVDQRFRKIGHRDILGALMSLQVDRHHFGDFWIDENYIYIYTSTQMGKFLCQELNRISSLNVSFEMIDERPEQMFQTKELKVSIASERIDAIVSSLAHCSRNEAKNMIRSGLVQCNHKVLEEPDKLCDNACVISIRGVGRFQYQGIKHRTKKDRMIAVFLQSVS